MGGEKTEGKEKETLKLESKHLIFFALFFAHQMLQQSKIKKNNNEKND